MEFGALIPLFYMTLCCLVVTPITGLAALLAIRFALRDTALARNIIITVAAVCLLWFIAPLIQLLVVAIIISQNLPRKLIPNHA